MGPLGVIVSRFITLNLSLLFLFLVLEITLFYKLSVDIIYILSRYSVVLAQ
jgi:hypothetical protein